jgi:hypothetical protein
VRNGVKVPRRGFSWWLVGARVLSMSTLLVLGAIRADLQHSAIELALLAPVLFATLGMFPIAIVTALFVRRVNHALRTPHDSGLARVLIGLVVPTALSPPLKRNHRSRVRREHGSCPDRVCGAEGAQRIAKSGAQALGVVGLTPVTVYIPE